MTDITELQRRITAALDRIGTGVNRMGAPADPGLADALEAERMANAQLEERVRAIKETQETTVATLEAEVASLRNALAATDADLQQVRSVNAELRASNAALRSANAEGLADAELVNAALQVELDALKALQAGDRAEIDRVLATIEPMLEETAHA
ncbi:MAG: hypothetical protein AAFY80_10275 [Pseudomonadota bacterium]